VISIIYGFLAICSGSVSVLPENIQLPEIYERIFTLNKGFIISIGVFFIIGGIFILNLIKWARTLLISAASFRILWLIISSVITFTILQNTDYQDQLEIEVGNYTVFFIILILLSMFFLELIAPSVIIFILSMKKNKKYFETLE